MSRRKIISVTMKIAGSAAVVFLFVLSGCSGTAGGAGAEHASAPAVPVAHKYPPVTLYTRSSCPYCKAAKAYMNKNRIPFVNKDVGEDRSALLEMVDIYRSRLPEEKIIVPLIVIGGAVVSGFDQGELENILQNPGAAAKEMNVCGKPENKSFERSIENKSTPRACE